MLLLCNTRSQNPSVGSRRGLFGLQNKFFIVWGHRLVFFFSLCSQSLVTPAETNPVVVSLYFIASSCDISFFYHPILLQPCFLYDLIDSLKYNFCLALMLIIHLPWVSDCCCIWKHFNWFSIVILCQDTSIGDIIITIHRVSSESCSLCTAPCCTEKTGGCGNCVKPQVQFTVILSKWKLLFVHFVLVLKFDSTQGCYWHFSFKYKCQNFWGKAIPESQEFNLLNTGSRK